MADRNPLTLILVVAISLLATGIGIRNLNWYLHSVDETIDAVQHHFSQ